MNRIENILLTLATAAALLLASTANADPNDGLHGIPVVKTPNGTRMARDLELEEANADSGTKPEDGLPGRPVLRTPNGTRTARDLEAEQANHSNGPCPKTGRDNNRNTHGTRTRSANEASSLLHQNDGLPLDLPGTPGPRTKDNELADRSDAMNSLKDAAKRNKKNTNNKIKNTTLGKALKRVGIDPKRLKGAKTKTDKYGSTTITLADGTVIMTGSDSDGLGTSVTGPNGDQTEVYPDGRVSTRKGKDGHTITTRPDGITLDYNPQRETLTVTDKNGNSETRNMDYWNDWFKAGHDAADLLRIYHPETRND